MELVALTDRQEIEKAIEKLKATLRSGSERRNLLIHTPGGDSQCVVMWHARHGLWALIDVAGEYNRYWCCYGTVDPVISATQRPIVEINPPIEGKNTHCRGVFARDPDKGIHYLHTGQIGGGAVGVGKAAFLASRVYDREQVVVHWPDGYSREMFDMGTLNDVHLVANLAAYVKAVKQFRENVGVLGEEHKRPRPTVFVSHCHEDNKWCRAFVELLGQRGVQVWYDEHNLGHGTLRDVIEKEMIDRPNFVVVLSPAAVASRWVREEMNAAKDLEYEDLDRIILPVMAEKCDVPLFFRSYKRVSGPGDTSVTPEEAARRVAQELKVEPTRP